MTTNCPHCSAVLASDSRFCTNCGTVLGGQVRQQGQVPPWARADAAVYQQGQQSWGGNAASPMESLGFASQNASLGQSLTNNDGVKKAILAIVVVIAVALATLLLLGVLAAFLPGLRWLFLLAIVGVFLLSWIVYAAIRYRIRRAIGRIGWFF